jgi:glyceraldehyde 3-phosphate dehydrogenase
MAIRIGINGFGRIGRQVYRAIRERYDKAIDVVAVNDIGRINIMAHLLKYDSTYGRFPGDVIARADGFVAWRRRGQGPGGARSCAFAVGQAGCRYCH